MRVPSALVLCSLALLFAKSANAGRVVVSSLDSNSIVIIDEATNTIERTFAVSQPYVGCAFSKDAARLYCSPISGGLLDCLSATTGETIWSRTTPAVMPADVVASPVESAAYVLSASPAGLYAITDFGTYSGATFVSTGESAASLTDLAISPDGRVALFGDLDNDKLWRVDLSTFSITSVVPPGMSGAPGALAYSHDGKRVYSDELSTGVFRIWDASLQTALGSRTGCGTASRMGLSNDGRKAYVTCLSPSGIVVVDLVGASPATTITYSGMPLGVAFSSTNSTAYACDASVGSTTIHTINAFSDTLGSPIPGPTRPAFPDMSPDPTRSTNACAPTWQGEPTPRHGHRLVWDSTREKLVLFGGESNGSILGDTWDWRDGRWNRAGLVTSPSSRRDFAMAWDYANETIVLFGGNDGAKSNTETWTRSASSWQRETPAASPLRSGSASMAFCFSIGKVVLHLGAAGSLPQETWFWDGIDWEQSTADGPSSGGVLVTDTWRNRVALFNGTQLHFFDGATWTPGPAMPVGHSVGGTFGFDEESGLFVAAGQGMTDGAATGSETWLATTSGWFQAYPSRLPPARDFAAMAFVPNAGLAMFGGGEWFGGSVYPTSDRNSEPTVRPDEYWVPWGDFWFWRAGDWSPKGLGSRVAFSAAFDRRRDRILVFGGVEIANFPSVHFPGGLLELVGRRWMPVASAHTPSPRMAAAFAYDDERDLAVLFGGANQLPVALLGDTWEWRGGDWLEKSWAERPSPRQSAAMAADPVRGGLLLFGGNVGSFLFSDETWRYDESGWHLLAPAQSPPARYGGSLAWDPVGLRLILVGGYGPAGILDDAWAWDGSGWTPLAAGAPGGKRWGAAMASAVPPDRLVLWGGTTEFPLEEDGLVWILGPGETWRSERHPLGPYPTRMGQLVLDPVSGRHTLLASGRGEQWSLGGRIWASWRLSATEVCPGQEVHWTYQGWSPVSDVSWDFGDGTTASGIVEPSHLYSASGTYTIRAEATFGCGKSVSESRVRVEAGPPPDIGNSVRVEKSEGGLRFVWSDLPTGAWYRLESSASPAFLPTSFFQAVASGNPGFEGTTIPAGGDVFYRVRAVGTCGVGQ